MMKVSSEVFRLQVLIDGRAVQEYRGPSGTSFIEGQKNKNFELELTNLTLRRILVHPAVDGLSVMTGKPASKNDSSHGYVLSPYQVMRVPGWRLDNESVSNFFFAGEGKSYAEQTGHGADKGVIACPVWEEQAPTIYFTPPMYPDSYTVTYSRGPIRHSSGGGRYGIGQSSMFYFGSGVNINCCQTEVKTSGELILQSCKVQNLGTGFGKQASHAVQSVSFVPVVQPTCVAIIYYDDLQGLQRRGIKIKKPQHRLPNPFPNDTGCTPPPGWQR